MVRRWRVLTHNAARAWSSLLQSCVELAEEERRALQRHVQDMRERAATAGQAGDAATLVRDQLELAPASRQRVRDDAVGVWRILSRLIIEWRTILQELRRQL